MEAIKEFFFHWGLEITAGLILAFFSAIWIKIKKEFKEQLAVEEGVRVLLHDRLYQAHSYYSEQGYIYPSDLRNIEYMYKAYHSLGGNGTGTTLYEEMKKLPKKAKKE